MKNFTYFRPTTVDAAIGLLEARWGNTELLAGGTDLHALQKEYVAQPARVVSLTGIADLSRIEVDGQNPPRWIKIGAGAKIVGPVTVGDGATVVTPVPTFALYRLLTDVLGGRPVGVPFTA